MAKEKGKHAEEQRRYRQSHPERIADQNKAYYEKNREAIQSRLKANRESGTEKTQGSLIRQHRQSLGMSQQKYAAAVGITQATLSLWENGKVPANVDVIRAAFPELADNLQIHRRLRKEDA